MPKMYQVFKIDTASLSFWNVGQKKEVFFTKTNLSATTAAKIEPSGNIRLVWLKQRDGCAKI